MYERPFIIAVDVDQTLLDLIPQWLKWTKKPIYMSDVIGVPGCLKETFEEHGVESPLDFWKQADLYQGKGVTPFSGAKDFLQELRNRLVVELQQDVELVAVSRCMPEHENSKRQFLADHFPSLFSGFVSTAQKRYVDFDLIIDDSVDTVECVAPTGRKILVPTSHSKIDLSEYDPAQIWKIGVDGVAGSWTETDIEEVVKWIITE